MIGAGPELATVRSQIRSGGKRLISNGPFMDSCYHPGIVGRA